MATPVILNVGGKAHGFIVRRVTPLKNLRASAFELEHQKTGARLLHVHSGDAENLFCVAFKTPPPDDTGLPHILEHSVLGGSKKYPVKDPFKEMVNMSMATFINAMTYPDKTVYPVASNVRKDFFNLADVYCDAVFHPRISANTLKQEGHHLEFARPGDPQSELIIKGIVYNEMKGAYSSADDYVDDRSFRWLFSNAPYSRDSGGDPEKIPDLTHKQFVQFHRDLYHPSNAYIFIFGDIPTADHLAFLNERLEGFRRKEVETPIARQRRWKKSKEKNGRYPISPAESAAGKAYITLNWLVGDAANPEEVLAFTVLDLILLGNEAAPLRKALIDSKLGEDLTSSGFRSDVQEGTFHVGLKGTEPGRLEAVRRLVLETLKSVVKNGVPRENSAAAFHQLGYRFLEIQSLFPLWLMDRAYRTWIYGADPLAFLRADEALEALRLKDETDPGHLTRLIQERLIDNPHRLDVVFAPDGKLQARKEAVFAAKMKRVKASMSPQRLAAIAREAKELERLQNSPNSAEALATLPQLKIKDLPAKPRHIPTRVEKLAGGVEFLSNDVFSNGVNYLQLSFDLDALPPGLFIYLPLYGDCLQKMGAAGLDYARMAERAVANTGGVDFGSSFSTRVDNASSLRHGRFSLKALDGKIGPALDVLRDLLFDLDFGDRPRFQDVITQAKAAHRGALVSNGLNMALRHAARRLNVENHLAEITNGLPQTRLIEKLDAEFEKQRAETVSKLEAIRSYFSHRAGFTASFTGSDKARDTVKQTLQEWRAKMRPSKSKAAAVSWDESGSPLREGLAAPMEVAYDAVCMPAPHLSHPDSALLTVGSRLLSLGFLWEEIRIKGGAYGGGCGYNPISQSWQFHSYRDPNVKKTLDTFRASLDFVRQAKWSSDDVARAIIGTAKIGERPIRPGEATGAALQRHLTGDSPERRDRRHAALLKAKPSEVKRALVELLEKNLDKGDVCVVSSREKLEAANLEMPGKELTIAEIMK